MWRYEITVPSKNNSETNRIPKATFLEAYLKKEKQKNKSADRRHR